ncbi:MAG TPA: hypothetical protein VIM59_12975, partial [Cellvibrio sp.]
MNLLNSFRSGWLFSRLRIVRLDIYLQRQKIMANVPVAEDAGQTNEPCGPDLDLINSFIDNSWMEKG